jgi:hypothetical protein
MLPLEYEDKRIGKHRASQCFAFRLGYGTGRTQEVCVLWIEDKSGCHGGDGGSGAHFLLWIDRSSSRFGGRSARDLGKRLVGIGCLLSNTNRSGRH